MPKFSGKQIRTATSTPIQTLTAARTFQDGTGFTRDAKSELFMLGVSNMVGEDTFYEGASKRDSRFRGLIHQVTHEDPAWLQKFLPWLRTEMYLRSAPVVGAAEYVAAGGPNGRALVNAVLKRPDEPGELLAYWFQTHGRRIPKALKRGVADAATRLYNERAAIKWDGERKAWRMGDVIDLTHPHPSAPWQAELFKYLLDVRHNRENPRMGESLEMLQHRKALENLSLESRRAVLYSSEALAEAGMTWESLSGWLQGPMDAQAWEAIIPSMGYMALLRNLRNFEEAGVNTGLLDQVAAKLCDEQEVANSKQFPLRFLSAWLANPSMTFASALEKACDLSVRNVPSLPGRSLILIDCSGSMFGGYFTQRSKAKPYQTAGLFGMALARRAESADLVAYGSSAVELPVGRTASILRLVESLESMGGTATWAVVQHFYANHDRVIILTDEQARDTTVGLNIPCVYTFNLQGYKVAHTEERPGWHTFGGGLTDACFRLLPVLEAQRNAGWPWEQG